MSGNEIPIFFKRRFNPDIFKQYLTTMMEEWTYTYKSKHFREFEVNVVVDSVHSYYKNFFNINIFGDLDLREVFKFQKFIEKKYEKVIKEYWDEHH